MFFGYVLFKHSIEFSSKTLRVGLGITIVQPRKKNIPASGADPRNISVAIRATLANVAQNELRTHHQSVVRLRLEPHYFLCCAVGMTPACQVAALLG